MELNSLKKINFFAVIFTLILIVETFFLVERVNIRSVRYSKNIEAVNTVFGELHRGNDIKEYIFPDQKNLTSLGFVFGTYNRINTDRILFELYDGTTDEKVREVLINTSILKDNNNFNIVFKPIKNSENKKYYFKLTSLEGAPNNSVTLYLNDDTNGILYNLGYKNMTYLISFLVIIITVVLGNILISLLLIRIQKREKVFLLLALSYGTIMVFLFPPFQVPDEKMHFFKAYAIAKREFVPEKLAMNKNGNELPLSILKLSNAIKSEEVKFKYEEKIELSDLKNSILIPVDKNKQDKISLQGAAIVNPLSYIPQSLGIFLGETFNLPIMIIFFMSRLFNFGVWTLIMYISIKKVPKIGNILLTLALMPLSIQQGISCSPDALINAFSFLFISYMLRLYLLNEETFNWKYGLCFFLGIFMPTTIKVVYLLFILLLIGLPVKKFNGYKKYSIVIISILFFTLLVNIGWSVLSPENPVSPVGQISYLKHNIMDYIGTVYLTTREMSQFYIESSIGVLGWLDTRIPYLMIYAYIILLLIHTFSKRIMPTKDFKMNVFMILYLLGSYVGILTALYIAWTKPGEKFVDGVQGRYFFPILPILFVYISKIKLRLRVNENVLDINTGIFLNFSMAYLVLLLVSRYYI
ncbi:DUF2142 domain-containing protein [Sebaldella sp. S0638]|uniref:DUF2142 domain-containing protein n=1 Tax=Sebaldella sp. S0638 TaxID=2957809 RepID=UPI0020A19B44|nr:DUF2142 domain-containing protein [Sebaldella sp. S0638]MCP1225885.1 DUF2142 domain-containing protein [Sebaldella sp. S0638]